MLKIRYILSLCSLLTVCALNGFAYEIDPSSAIASNVTTWAELVDALGNNSVKEVVLANTITLGRGNYSIDALGKTVRVEVPYCDDHGHARSGEDEDGNTEVYSMYNLFTVNVGATLTVTNMIMKGGSKGASDDSTGYYAAGGIINYGTLTLVDSAIGYSCTALYNATNALAVMIRSDIARNANTFGGGLMNRGTFVMDCGALAQNRSLGAAGGGGAVENNGLMLINNSTISMNSSTEIGGAINNTKGGRVYIANSSIIGNITTSSYGAYSGGGIGNNGGGNPEGAYVYVVNSIMADNFYFNAKTGEFTPSDIGLYSGNDVYVYGCLYASVVSVDQYTKPTIDSASFIHRENDIFAGYRNDGIIIGEEGISPAYDHPAVISHEGGDTIWSFYAPLSANSPAVTDSAYATYFDYSALYENHANKAVMSFVGMNGINTALGPDVIAATDESCRVLYTYDGADRIKQPVIGSGSVTQDLRPLCTIYMRQENLDAGHGDGVSIFGETCYSGTVFTVYAHPQSAHYFVGWYTNAFTGVYDEIGPERTATEYADLSRGRTVWSFTVSGNTVVTPDFTMAQPMILKARQRYPWNGLIDIDYFVDADAVKYRLLFFASFTDDRTGEKKIVQLKSFVDNKNISKVIRLNTDDTYRSPGWHRVTWDANKDGVANYSRNVTYRVITVPGGER